MYISAWEAYTGNVYDMIESAIEAGTIDGNDVVFAGPSGDYVVGDEAYNEEYAEYFDSGTAQEWVDTPAHDNS